jgi:uncharacterized protein DUF4917
MPVLSFAEALKETAPKTGQLRHLLVGNGFSMAQGGARFDYPTLLERSGLPDNGEIRNVFRQLRTVDFEEVMRALEHAAVIEAAYGECARSDRFNRDAGVVRDALIQAVREVHPGLQFDIPEDQRTACATFLRNFDQIFTLNYDLLLYWVIIHGARAHHRDGFGLGETIDGFRTFSLSANCTVFFVHGALHLFLDDQNGTRKRVVTNATIVNDITETIRRSRRLPLFVAEGTDAQKMRKINSVPYLRHAYEQLINCNGSLFIFGHSASENDSHIYAAVTRSRITTIYYCVFRPQDALSEVQARLARRLASNPRIQVKYVDSGTVTVWEAAA